MICSSIVLFRTLMWGLIIQEKMKGKGMDDQRIIDIEMKLAYQERMISELNTVIYDQQKIIDELKKTSRLLLDRVIELSNDMAQSDIADEKPPHY